MIYLTIGIDFDKSDLGKLNESVKMILKIGYTENIESGRRETTYRTSGILPGFILVREGTLTDERALHYYFRKYKYPKLSEWFIFSQEIIDNFMIPYEDLYHGLWCFREDLFSALPKEGTLDYNIIERLYSENYNTLLRSNNPYDWKKVDHLWNKRVLSSYQGDSLPDFIAEFVKEFQIDGIFERRMRLYCDFLKKFYNILGTTNIPGVPQEYQNYINLLGPDRCKALGYYQASLEREYQVVTSGDTRKEMILNNFQISQKYTLKEIKEKLREIYTTLGITKTPKASDLEEYYEVKETKIWNPSEKKQSKGYQLISIK